jgi:hypothetical protein
MSVFWFNCDRRRVFKEIGQKFDMICIRIRKKLVWIVHKDEQAHRRKKREI